MRTGPPGAQGDVGATGAQGSVGAQATQGATGAQGAQGDVGAQGATGSQGSQGATGAQGAQGVQGAQGAAAPTTNPTFSGTLSCRTINATTDLQISWVSTNTLYQQRSFIAAVIPLGAVGGMELQCSSR